MTILIAFHQSNYRIFKHFYLEHVCRYWRAAFPQLVSYTRFVQLKKEVLTLLGAYLTTRHGDCPGVSFVDSTRLRVCDNKRIPSHKVFAGHAERGKTSMGWFYGFKLHLIISDTGDILAAGVPPGNTDDRTPLWKMPPTEKLHGCLYGDKGYISAPLREKLGGEGVTLIYKVRKNMAPLELSACEEVLLRKRMLIETVIGVLKSQTQLEHSRHRSVVNFQVNVAAVLIAYQLSEDKPSLKFKDRERLTDLARLPKN